jgi:hypothetical protein
MVRHRARTALAAIVVVATAVAGSVGAGTAGAAATVPRRRREREAPQTCGPAWTVASTAGSGNLTSVAEASATSAWAVGYTPTAPTESVVQHYDGTGWSVVAAPSLDGSLLAGVAAVGTTSTWAVGRTFTGTRTRTFVEHGTPKGWKVVRSPSLDKSDGLTAVSGTGPDDVWAVGRRSIGKKVAALIEHYDGAAWTVSDTSLLAGQISLTGVHAIAPNDAWAVGSDALNKNRTTTYAAHWDGTAWTTVPTPNASHLLDVFAGISGSASDDVWAVGDTLQSLSPTTITTLTEHWDGTSWTIVPSPNPSSIQYLYGVAATSSGHAVAVGASDNVGNPAPFGWDGLSWSAQATPESGQLTAVASSPGGPIWAVGERLGTPLIEESCP